MGMVFDGAAADLYRSWQKSRQGRALSEAMGSFIQHLLEPRPGDRVLDIGCGVGDALLSLRSKNVIATGLDASPQMLAIAAGRVGKGCALVNGIAEDLPFEDNEFDAAMLINTLEFVDDPEKAIMEAARVASRKIIVASINKWSPGGAGNRLRGIFGNRLFRGVRLYSLWGLRRLILDTCGHVSMSWAGISGPLPGRMERILGIAEGVGRRPFGVMVGVSAGLVYTLRAEPLTLSVGLKSAGHTTA